MKVMRKFLTLFLLACCCTNMMQAFENNCYNDQPNNQQIDKLVANEQGVFLFVDDLWIEVEEVQATSNGILVLVNGVWMPLHEALECITEPFMWKCPNEECGRLNSHCLRYSRLSLK